MGEQVVAPRHLHLFWDTPMSIMDGASTPVGLPTHELLGMWTACEVGFKVHLWSYSGVEKAFAHENLTHEDATVVLPIEGATVPLEVVAGAALGRLRARLGRSGAPR